MPEDKIPETSEDILAQINSADVSEAEEAEEMLDLEDEEKEEEETKESEEEEAEETSEEETEAAETEGEETKPRLFKIVVDGKEEYVTEEQIIQYAQKGRFLERERAKDKEEGKPFDEEKAEQMFVEQVKKDGFLKTSADLMLRAIKSERVQMRETKKEARLLADSADWGKDTHFREEFMDLVEDGLAPDDAATKVAVKYWEGEAKKGQAKGAEKQKKKAAADIKAGKESIEDEREAGGETPTMENYEKLRSDKKTTSADLLKFMQKAGVQVGRDTFD